MEALLSRLLVCAAALASMGASYRTPNFVVSATTPELAREIGETAEKYRVEMAEHWLGHTLPDWSQPCPIAADVGEKGAGGVTSFVFDRGEVYRWEMAVQGTRERVLESVRPHEVTHTIFASHFRQQLPRWADEGACTTVEHDSERAKHRQLLVQFLRTGRGIAFNEMFRMKEYPHDILPLYSQGHALAQFLIGKKGPRTFVRFVDDGLESDDWSTAVDKHYGFHDLSELQTDWLTWVKRGCPAETPMVADATMVEEAAPIEAARLLGQAAERLPRPTPNLIYRAQNATRTQPNAAPSSPGPPNGVSADGWRAPAGNRRMRSLAGNDADPDRETPESVAHSDNGREVILEWRRDDHRLK